MPRIARAYLVLRIMETKRSKYIRDKEKNPKAYESAPTTHQKKEKKNSQGGTSKMAMKSLKSNEALLHFPPTSFPSLENDFQPRI